MVHGFDGMTDYYDVALKQRRQELLLEHGNFSATQGMLEDDQLLLEAAEAFRPDVIVHLAAQAGVRYSIEMPRTYIDSNIVGTFNVMEAARRFDVGHLLMASTSSVYGGNEKMPFQENDKADLPLTIYAATKKANEAMAHSYAHLWNIPTTMFRFFTVYGPWGRPDLALFKFVDAILDGRPIDIYNHGEMYRDFTYIDDLVHAICRLITVVPECKSPSDSLLYPGDSISPVAPYRVVNIGNSTKVKLLDFVEAIEECLGKPAIRNYLDMQMGDVPATWADATLLHHLTDYRPQTPLHNGVAKFVAWFREYYAK